MVLWPSENARRAWSLPGLAVPRGLARLAIFGLLRNIHGGRMRRFQCSLYPVVWAISFGDSAADAARDTLADRGRRSSDHAFSEPESRQLRSAGVKPLQGEARNLRAAGVDLAAPVVVITASIAGRLKEVPTASNGWQDSSCLLYCEDCSWDADQA